MSWEYLPADDLPEGIILGGNAPLQAQPASVTQGPSFLQHAEAVNGDLQGHYAQRDEKDRQGAARQNRIKTIGGLLKTFYDDKRYRPFRPENTQRVCTSIQYYQDLLESPETTSSPLRQAGIFRPELAVAHLAALSVLNKMPVQLSKVARPVLKYLGFGSQTLLDNIENAREYLIENRILLRLPYGAQCMTRPELQPFGLNPEELVTLGLGATGLDELPAPFTVLFADIIHSKSNPIMPLERPVREQKLSRAQATLAVSDRLTSYSGRPQDGLNLQRRELKEIDEASELVARDHSRRITIAQRKMVEDIVRQTGADWLGFRTIDPEALHVISELLVLKAHGFPNNTMHLSEEVIQSLVTRFLDAAQRSKVQNESDLPRGEARDIYMAVRQQLAKQQAAREAERNRQVGSVASHTMARPFGRAQGQS